LIGKEQIRLELPARIAAIAKSLSDNVLQMPDQTIWEAIR